MAPPQTAGALGDTERAAALIAATERLAGGMEVSQAMVRQHEDYMCMTMGRLRRAASRAA